MAYAVNSVDKFLVQIGALDQCVKVHQRLNCVFETMIHIAYEFFQFPLMTTDNELHNQYCITAHLFH